MKCQGKFKFKGLQKRDGGKFTNSNGQEINYAAKYQLKVDEQTEDGIYERTFNISLDSPLLEVLLITKPYSDIVIEFDIVFYGNNCRVIPVAILDK